MKRIKATPYKVIAAVVLAALAFFFIFPLYWILTGSVKTAAVINDAVPQWFPLSPTADNYQRLFDNPALLWLFNTDLCYGLNGGIRSGKKTVRRKSGTL